MSLTNKPNRAAAANQDPEKTGLYVKLRADLTRAPGGPADQRAAQLAKARARQDFLDLQAAILEARADMGLSPILLVTAADMGLDDDDDDDDHLPKTETT